MPDSTQGSPLHGASITRFEQLLRPIRDLTSNWHVDVVAVLSDYMQDLGIDISAVDERELTQIEVDFKQAALLVEGSTGVYSRKVDYLYSLVFSTADMVYNARGKSFKARKSADGNSDDTDADTGSEEVEFLLLDDVLDEQQARHEDITLAPRDFNETYDLNCAKDIARLVPIPLHLLPRSPQTGRPQSSAVASQAGLRIAETTLDEATGTLILDGIGASSNLPTTDLLERARDSDAGVEPEYDVNDCDISVDEDIFPKFSEELILGNAQTGTRSEVGEPGVQAMGSEGQRECDPLSSVTSPKCNHQDMPNALRESVKDPFASLDVNDAGHFKIRPAQKGKTWTQYTLKLVNPPLREPDGQSDSILFQVLRSAQATFRRKTNRCISAPAFEKAFKSRLRTLATQKRARSSHLCAAESHRLNSVAYEDYSSQELLGEMETETMRGRGASELLVNLPIDGGFGNEGGLSADETDEDNGCGGNIDDERGHSGDMDSPDELSQIPQLDNVLPPERGSSNLWGGQNSSAGSEVELIAASYEEACRAYLRETSILWKQHSACARVDERVSQWRNRIEPALEDEESHPPFDIKAYGRAILQDVDTLCQGTSSPVHLGSVFSCTKQYEVCRKFLATLQLVNNYDIKFARATGQDANLFNPLVQLCESSAQRKSAVDKVSTPKKQVRRRHYCTNQNYQSPDSAALVTPPSKQGAAPGKRNRQTGTTPASMRRQSSRQRVSPL